MTDHARRLADVNLGARFRRLIEQWLPWFDAAAEREHRQHTAELERRLDKVVPKVEQLRRDYAAMDRRLKRSGR